FGRQCRRLRRHHQRRAHARGRPRPARGPCRQRRLERVPCRRRPLRARPDRNERQRPEGDTGALIPPIPADCGCFAFAGYSAPMWNVLSEYWPHILAVLSVAMAAPAIVHVVMNKEEVRSAIGWVGVILLSPI